MGRDEREVDDDVWPRREAIEEKARLRGVRPIAVRRGVTDLMIISLLFLPMKMCKLQEDGDGGRVTT